MGGEPTPFAHPSGQEVILILVIQVCEVILSAAVTTERRAVRELLQVVEPARDALVAVRIERVEVDGRPADDPGVELRSVEDPEDICANFGGALMRIELICVG